MTSPPPTSENIFVCCRVRPMLGTTEKEAGPCLKILPDCLSIQMQNGHDERTFGFEKVFSPYATQEDIFSNVVVPMLSSFMNGYSAAIIAYGQTASGKTHTMLGTPESPGIIPRISEELFRRIEEASVHECFTVSCRAVQIYKEKLIDMLSPSETPQHCEIYEDNSRGLWVTDATECAVTSAAEVQHVIAKAETMRVVASTMQNVESSRSHAVFILTAVRRDLSSAVEKTSLLYLVDLAGSECIEKTQSSGLLLDEARYINTSLLTLRRVIDSLINKESHVPYRDSKLTRLLKNSFGGNSKTSLIVCVSPSLYNEAETMATLRFGSSTRQITNRPQQSVTRSAEELERLIAEAQVKVLQAKAYLFLLQTETERVEGTVVKGMNEEEGGGGE